MSDTLETTRITPAEHTARRLGPGRAPFPGMAWIPGGTSRMGSDDHYPEEAPAHEATVAGFWMDRMPVTNANFARFVEATGYVTIAERELNPADYPGARPELLVPGSVVFRQPDGPVSLSNHFAWWDYVPGASWRHPAGPESAAAGLSRHPVVHVAFEDAQAYARWAGKALPTEAEWELAARGGLEGRVYTWGDELSPGGRIMANVWQGEFPRENLLQDGWERTSPVGSFPPNGYGLYDMIGNVWEWTDDWWRAHESAVSACCASNGAGGREASMDPAQPDVHIPARCSRGARTCARRTTACAIAPPPASPSRWTRGRGTRDFAASSASRRPCDASRRVIHGRNGCGICSPVRLIRILHG